MVILVIFKVFLVVENLEILIQIVPGRPIYYYTTDPRVNGYQRGLSSMVYKFSNERTKGSGITNKENLVVNTQLVEEFHKPIIKNFKRRKVYFSFKDNIWGVDLADMQLISKYNKGIRYILCVIDLFSR